MIARGNEGRDEEVGGMEQRLLLRYASYAGFDTSERATLRMGIDCREGI